MMFETAEQERQAFVDLAYPSCLTRLNGRGLYRRIGPDKSDPENEESQYSRVGVDWMRCEQLPDDVHIYASPTLRVAVGNPGIKKGTYASVLIWVDVDGDKGNSLQQAIDIATTAGIPPTAVVLSGAKDDRGHLYWLLDSPFFVQEDLEKFEAMLKRLCLWLGGDPKVAQAAAVMRWPGTLNVKPVYGEPPPMCRFVDLDLGRTYSWADLDTAVPNAPVKPRTRPGVERRSTNHATTGGGAWNIADLGRRLQCCDFVGHCVNYAESLGEGLWVDMLWNLKDLGEAGQELALAYSCPHPRYSEVETIKKINYAKAKGYTAACSKIVEDGFACEKYDPTTRRCAVFPVRAPVDLVLSPERDTWVVGRQTFHRGRNGDKCIAEFIVCIDKEVRSPDGAVLIGRAVTVDGRCISLQFPSALLGDSRALNRVLAGALGGSFLCNRKALDEAWRTWLTESEIVREEITHDFGLQAGGSMFCDPAESIPPSAARFKAPEGSPSRRLGLQRVRTNHELCELARVLTTCWPVLNGPEVVEFLLGCAGWALIAPVLEARPGVEPLIAWLCGATGRGKTLHSIVAQSLFGAFNDHSLVHFGSTALGIEDQSYWFHGALMVVDDIKASTKGADGFKGFLAFIQRAYGRTPRQKLTRQGIADAGRPCRTTLLLNGEDMILTESSALARVLTYELGPQNVDSDAAAMLLDSLPKLSALTRDLASSLVGKTGWADGMAERYDASLRRLSQGLSGGANRTRLAKSAAAVLCGLELWLDRFSALGAEHPFDLARLEATLVGQAQEQMQSVDASKPGERFLTLVRVALGSGRFCLQGEGRQGGALVGRSMHDRDDALVCLCYRSLLPFLRSILEDGESLPPQDSIRKSLVEMGAMGECNANRGTRAVRLDGQIRQTWPIRRAFIFPEEED